MLFQKNLKKKRVSTSHFEKWLSLIFVWLFFTLVVETWKEGDKSLRNLQFIVKVLFPCNKNSVTVGLWLKSLLLSRARVLSLLTSLGLFTIHKLFNTCASKFQPRSYISVQLKSYPSQVVHIVMSGIPGQCLDWKVEN